MTDEPIPLSIAILEVFNNEDEPVEIIDGIISNYL